MPDYKEMYLTPFRATEDAINCLIATQRACEEKFIESGEDEFSATETNTDKTALS